MEVLAQLGKIGASINQPFGEVTRVAGGEADAFDSPDVMNVMEQVGERVLAPALRGDAR